MYVHRVTLVSGYLDAMLTNGRASTSRVDGDHARHDTLTAPAKPTILAAVTNENIFSAAMVMNLSLSSQQKSAGSPNDINPDQLAL